MSVGEQIFFILIFTYFFFEIPPNENKSQYIRAIILLQIKKLPINYYSLPNSIK